MQTVFCDAAVSWYLHSNILYLGRNFFNGFFSIAWFFTLFWWNAHRAAGFKYYCHNIGLYWLAHWATNDGEL